MVEYPAFMAKIPPQIIIEEAHIAYWNQWHLKSYLATDTSIGWSQEN
jgi:hypothetical protein